jgi:hypothetical protein
LVAEEDFHREDQLEDESESDFSVESEDESDEKESLSVITCKSN